MKKMVIVALIVWAVMLLLPLSVIGKGVKTTEIEVISPQKTEKKKEAEILKVLDANTQKITEMNVEDYLFCVVAAEMPALYETEALKAQAVAAYTFALKRSQENADKDYDITTDYKKDQSFITKEKARENWGDKASVYEEKIKNAISETKGYRITYKGENILAVYHAVSGGKTADSADIWGVELEYLKPVLSEWDKLYENYISKETFTASEIKEIFNDVEFSGDENEYFSDVIYNDSSAVKTVEICGTEFTGEKTRERLSLRSPNFTVEYKDDEFEFTVYGFGHGVGMSQYGADCMAKNGSDFKEILKYYYTDCKVEK